MINNLDRPKIRNSFYQNALFLEWKDKPHTEDIFGNTFPMSSPTTKKKEAINEQ